MSFFSIRVAFPGDAEEELNQFLKTIRVIHLHKELVREEGHAYWAKALERCQEFARKSEWYLKLDIRKYFDSIDHQIILYLLVSIVKNYLPKTGRIMRYFLDTCFISEFPKPNLILNPLLFLF